jgi:lipoyl(octanoyl) transferase
MENWYLLRSGPSSAALNMAIDETLLHEAHQLVAPVLRFYSWNEPAASFGYFQAFTDVARATALRPLVRRPTGGGIVPHDRDWTYSLVFPPSHAWYHLKATESYRRVHQWVTAAFQHLRVDAELASQPRRAVPGQCFAGAEQFDVLLRDKKIAGAAQRRTRHGLLIQGSIQPPSQADRRAWESAFREYAAKQWQVQWSEWQLPSDLQQRAALLAVERYSSPAYNQKR